MTLTIEQQGQEWVIRTDRREVVEAVVRVAGEPAVATPADQKSEVRLWDSQWTNVVNHDNCYRGWDMEDAIAHAVKMAERLIAQNVATGNLPPISPQPTIRRSELKLKEGDVVRWADGSYMTLEKLDALLWAQRSGIAKSGARITHVNGIPVVED